jgi:hypothetical protein
MPKRILPKPDYNVSTNWPGDVHPIDFINSARDHAIEGKTRKEREAILPVFGRAWKELFYLCEIDTPECKRAQNHIRKCRRCRGYLGLR